MNDSCALCASDIQDLPARKSLWQREGWRLTSQRWTSYPTGKLMTSERTVASRRRRFSPRTCESSRFGSLFWRMSHNLARVYRYLSGEKKIHLELLHAKACRAKRLTSHYLINECGDINNDCLFLFNACLPCFPFACCCCCLWTVIQEWCSNAQVRYASGWFVQFHHRMTLRCV